MKFERRVVETVDVDAIRVIVPVRYDEEDIPKDFFGRVGDTLTLVLELDSKRVRGWPSGTAASVHMKVVDEGRYQLLAGETVIADKVNGYVPSVLPGEHYGDYLILDIGEDGSVEDWNPKVRKLAESFGAEE